MRLLLTYMCVTRSASVFRTFVNCFLDTLIQKIFLLIIKIHTFQGELSDVSAETATLVFTSGDYDFKTK